MILPVNRDWNEALKSEYAKPYFSRLCSFVDARRAEGKTIYPSEENVFRALDLCPPGKVKAVILGQDPYHEEGQAMGLSFSVPDGTGIPPSLRNIFRELRSDVGVEPGWTSSLEKWEKEGVLLLNSILTVEKGRAASHEKLGWQTFTDAIISYLSENYSGIVFMLWGNYARGKATLIDPGRHLILEAAHPSPLARGAFFGSRPFSQANAYLTSIGKSPINWSL